MLVPTVRTDKRVVEGADPYGEMRVCVVGAGALDSPAGKAKNSRNLRRMRTLIRFRRRFLFVFPSLLICVFPCTGGALKDYLRVASPSPTERTESFVGAAISRP